MTIASIRVVRCVRSSAVNERVRASIYGDESRAWERARVRQSVFANLSVCHREKCPAFPRGPALTVVRLSAPWQRFDAWHTTGKNSEKLVGVSKTPRSRRGWDRAVDVACHSRGARGSRAPGRRADAARVVRVGGGRARSPRSRLATRGRRFEETARAMAGARKERRARGSGDSGDTPSGERAGNDGAGAVASSMDWETPEVLAAMNDADFARAVQRAVASHRKIFVHQERNWAAVRLRANLRTTRVAAERARQGLGASGRARARETRARRARKPPFARRASRRRLGRREV